MAPDVAASACGAADGTLRRKAGVSEQHRGSSVAATEPMAVELKQDIACMCCVSLGLRLETMPVDEL